MFCRIIQIVGEFDNQ